MSDSILNKIHSPEDVKKLDPAEIPVLASEIRQTILKTIANNGGHLSSNLGIVELTIALHRVFSSPEDAIVWDVGHQCYVHKLLTGRADEFGTIRCKDGLAGFPKREESIYDAFDTGHASTSISAATGILEGRRIQGIGGKSIAVIGDGAMTGGLAFEALLNAGKTAKNLIVILNDNQMSISKNTSVFSEYLSRLTVRHSYQRFKYLFDSILERIPFIGRGLLKAIRRLKRAFKGLFFKTNLFVEFGFDYVGPLNGHNEARLEKVFQTVKKISSPVVIHIQTHKGHGYRYAEHDPSTFHGIGPFNLSDGKVEKSSTQTFSSAFSKVLLELGHKNPNLVAITAAMLTGTGLIPFSREFPERCFDVGIAEAHAVTFSAGLASTGVRPIVAVYSTFLQRAVDQVIHDVAIQNLPVIFAIDRAGAVPFDGETHQGLFDISILRSVPNFTVMIPVSAVELGLMFDWAMTQSTPIAIRYPKMKCPKEVEVFSAPIEAGRGVFVHKHEKSELLIVCTGGIYQEVKAAVDILAYDGHYADIYNLRFAKPIDMNYFLDITKSYSAILFVEDGIKIGGVSEFLCSQISTYHSHILHRVLAFPDKFYPQGSRADILEFAGLSDKDIVEAVNSLLVCLNSNQSVL